jgi:hypothetical protein
MTTAPKPITIGIDPGGRYTGIAAVAADLDAHQRRILLGAKVLTSPAGELLDPVRLPRACAEVLAAIDEALETFAAHYAGVAVEVQHEARTYAPDAPDLEPAATAIRSATPAELVELGHLVIAVEGLAAPKGFAGGQRAAIDPQGLVSAGVILGAILGRWPRAVVVDPGGNGSNPTITYPEQLRKGARLGGPSDHARSAYDVAVRARATAAMRANFAAQADPSRFRATPRG